MRWFDKIATKVSPIHRVIGVHVNLERNADVQVSYTIIERKGDRIHLMKSGVGLSIESFLLLSLPKLPICLSIEGKGVISKKLENDQQLKEVLAGAKSQELVYNLYQGLNCQFISFSRKALYQEVLNHFLEAGYNVIQASLGVYSPLALYPLIHPKPDVLILKNSLCIIKDGTLFDIQASTQQKGEVEELYSIEREKFTGDTLIPYSNAVNCLAGLSLFQVSTLADNRIEFVHKGAFRKAFLAVLILFISFGLAGSLWYISLQDENKLLTEQNMVYSHQLKVLEKLEKERDEKLLVLNTLKLYKVPKFAFHADKLGESVPEDIRLTSLNLHPVQTMGKSKKEISYRFGIVKVEGVCKSTVSLNNWLIALERAPWVKAIEDQAYTSSFDKGAGDRFEFSVILSGHD